MHNLVDNYDISVLCNNSGTAMQARRGCFRQVMCRGSLMPLSICQSSVQCVRCVIPFKNGECAAVRVHRAFGASAFESHPGSKQDNPPSDRICSQTQSSPMAYTPSLLDGKNLQHGALWRLALVVDRLSSANVACV